MNLFKRYKILKESTKDLANAIGIERTDRLVTLPINSNVQKLHDSVFGAGVDSIDIPLHNPVPEKVEEHVKSKGDSLEGDKVKLKSGRLVELSKYLPRTNAPKSVLDDHENWDKNKGDYGNTKLVITRHPGEVASCSTNTHWDSCANMVDDGDAANVMSYEIRHGTLMGMHVHKDSTPNEDGEYDSKDVLGRVLIKRHNDSDGNISFHREDRKYGMFPDTAKKAVDDFTEKNYPMKNLTAKKESSLYNDDGITIKVNPNATSEHIYKALDDNDHYVREEAILHHNATKDHINKALNDQSPMVRKSAKEQLAKRFPS